MTNSTIELLIKNIKYFRTQKNFTQEKLSEISGISKDYLSEIERGKKTPSIKRLIKIAEALDIDIDQINVKATTEEGLGFTGEGLGIASNAICIVEKA